MLKLLPLSTSIQLCTHRLLYLLTSLLKTNPPTPSANTTKCNKNKGGNGTPHHLAPKKKKNINELTILVKLVSQLLVCSINITLSLGYMYCMSLVETLIEYSDTVPCFLRRWKGSDCWVYCVCVFVGG